MELLLENDVLMTAAEKMSTSEPGLLNLVRSDWRNVLENNPTFQTFKESASEAYYSPIENKSGEQQRVSVSNIMNVLVMGKWILYVDPKKGYEILIASECEPLEELMRTMLSDVDKEKYKFSDASFFVETCNPIFCRWCRSAREKLKLSPHSDKREWCILKTRVYDGDKIKNVFKSSIENNFRGQPFYGILNLQLNSRSFYQDKYGIECCRIGGTCKNMILFKETCLVVNPELDLDYVETSEPNSSIYNPDSEPSIGPDVLDFLNSVPMNYAKRSKDDEKTPDEPNKRFKGNVEDDEPIQCIPKNVDHSNELENEDDFDVTTNIFSMS